MYVGDNKEGGLVMEDTLNTWDFKLGRYYDKFSGGKGYFLEDHIAEVWRMDWRGEKSGKSLIEQARDNEALNEVRQQQWEFKGRN